MPEDSPEISSGIFLDPPHCNRNLSMKRQLSFKTNIRHQNRLVGLIIEVHNNPECAWSDGMQSLKPEKFKNVIEKAKLVVQSVGRSVYEG